MSEYCIFNNWFEVSTQDSEFRWPWLKSQLSQLLAGDRREFLTSLCLSLSEKCRCKYLFYFDYKQLL